MSLSSTLAAAGVFVIAFASSAAAQPGLQEPVEPETEPEVEPRPIRQPFLKRANPNATDEVWGGGVRLTGLSGVGALPGVNIGGEVAVHLRWEERFIELGLAKWRPQETIVVEQTTDRRVELGLDLWSVRGGWASKTMPLRAWLLVEAGELASPHKVMPAGVPRMVMGSVPSEHKWFAAGGGFGVQWPMSKNARLVGNVELAIPIDREPMMLDTGGSFEPDAATARCSLGLELGWR
jgi:hypothetical protein